MVPRALLTMTTLLLAVGITPRAVTPQWDQRAKESALADACFEKALTQSAMNQCAGQEEVRANAELDSTYRLLLAKAADRGADDSRIKAMQKAWWTYRDAYVDAWFPLPDKRVEYGSMYPMSVAMLMARLAREQTVALRALVDQYSP